MNNLLVVIMLEYFWQIYSKIYTTKHLCFLEFKVNWLALPIHRKMLVYTIAFLLFIVKSQVKFDKKCSHAYAKSRGFLGKIL